MLSPTVPQSPLLVNWIHDLFAFQQKRHRVCLHTHTQKCHVAHPLFITEKQRSWSRPGISIKISHHCTAKPPLQQLPLHQKLCTQFQDLPGKHWAAPLNTSLFISGWAKLYKQFVFHNEEVLYPFQLQTLQTSSLCSGEQSSISQCRINETYHCTGDQKAFLCRQVFTLPQKILWRPQHFNQMPSSRSVIKQSTLKDIRG